MKLEVGMHVRTKIGNIGKITFISPLDGLINLDTESYSIGKHFVDKASHNIIDLIETGDVLLLFSKEYDEKYKAEVILDSEDFKSIVDYEQTNLLNLKYELITEEHIKLLSIVTKEQFESMSYKVEVN